MARAWLLRCRRGWVEGGEKCSGASPQGSRQRLASAGLRATVPRAAQSEEGGKRAAAGSCPHARLLPSPSARISPRQMRGEIMRGEILVV